MVSLSTIVTTIICSSMACQAAKIYPPRTCDRDNVKNCVALFDKAYAQADPNDLQSQCELVLHEGAKCYAPCPQEELTKFIEEYDNGRCKDYRPSNNRVRRDEHDDSPLDFPQIRNEGLEWQAKRRPKLQFGDHAIPELSTGSLPSILGSLRITPGESGATTTTTTATATTDNSLDYGEARTYGSKTVTVTRTPAPDAQTFATAVQGHAEKTTDASAPIDSQSTSALDPAEYHSRLQKSRYKENLRSVRSRQAQESAEAEAEARAGDTGSLLKQALANKVVVKSPFSQQLRSAGTSSGHDSTTTSATKTKSSAARAGFSISLVAFVLLMPFM